MPGTKTSVWLGESEHARWKASGLSLTEIVKAGLDAIEAQRPDAEDGRAVLREELAAFEERADQRAEERQARLLRELQRMAGR